LVVGWELDHIDKLAEELAVVVDSPENNTEDRERELKSEFEE